MGTVTIIVLSITSESIIETSIKTGCIIILGIVLFNIFKGIIHIVKKH